MKKLLTTLLSCLAVFSASSQTVTISPLPQKITWGEQVFTNAQAFYVVGADKADKDAIELLSNKLNIVGTHTKVDAKKFPNAKPIIIGEVGDKAVSKYKKLVPTNVEGYYLNVTADQIVIAGRDNSGTYYGTQSLMQIMSQPDVMQCEITDFPSVTDRGVIEGFYGNPWSHKDRLRQFDFYGQYKMNTYVFGPKDDPYHRARWREPYPADEAAVFKAVCDKAGVPCQYFVNHSDSAGGSTLGNILTSQLDLRGVDMGSAMWAMHSVRETCSTDDHVYVIKAFTEFYNS